MLVTPEFLYPCQVDDRHHADEPVGVPRDVDLGPDHCTVQAFAEEQVGVGRKVFPGREGTGVLIVRRRLDRVMQAAPAAKAFRYFMPERAEAQLAQRFAPEPEPAIRSV